ncbi:Trypanosomal VSG domain [Trypanosoma vivax]|nr:Trypanosomal VSG domain [Trypanosoma vivax]
MRREVAATWMLLALAAALGFGTRDCAGTDAGKGKNTHDFGILCQVARQAQALDTQAKKAAKNDGPEGQILEALGGENAASSTSLRGALRAVTGLANVAARARGEAIIRRIMERVAPRNTSESCATPQDKTTILCRARRATSERKKLFDEAALHARLALDQEGQTDEGRERRWGTTHDQTGKKLAADHCLASNVVSLCTIGSNTKQINPCIPHGKVNHAKDDGQINSVGLVLEAWRLYAKLCYADDKLPNATPATVTMSIEAFRQALHPQNSNGESAEGTALGDESNECDYGGKNKGCVIYKTGVKEGTQHTYWEEELNKAVNAWRAAVEKEQEERATAEQAQRALDAAHEALAAATAENALTTQQQREDGQNEHDHRATAGTRGNKTQDNDRDTRPHAKQGNEQPRGDAGSAHAANASTQTRRACAWPAAFAAWTAHTAAK